MEHFAKVARAGERRIGTIVSGSPQEPKTTCRQCLLSLQSGVCCEQQQFLQAEGAPQSIATPNANYVS